ncbi:PAAR domain-containing protein [Aliarcobacter butzleri]|uniref:hypothetical protein n=1 Tax=Aliarcobacter butzleri TaxID=28197 RepID=UPI00125FD67C|nr:hypothetical protein [Aliarcobacter butzleri]
MSGICRVGIDSAGGVIVGVNQNGTVFTNGFLVSVDKDRVQGHGTGTHAGPVMIAKSKNVFVNGIAVCKEGNTATCGHPASGSTDVFVG